MKLVKSIIIFSLVLSSSLSLLSQESLDFHFKKYKSTTVFLKMRFIVFFKIRGGDLCGLAPRTV